MHIRNCIFVLEKLINVFPLVDWSGKVILGRTAKLKDSESREDLKVFVLGYHAKLAQKEKLWQSQINFTGSLPPQPRPARSASPVVSASSGQSKTEVNLDPGAKPFSPRPSTPLATPLSKTAAISEGQPSAAEKLEPTRSSSASAPTPTVAQNESGSKSGPISNTGSSTRASSGKPAGNLPPTEPGPRSAHSDTDNKDKFRSASTNIGEYEPASRQDNTIDRNAGVSRGTTVTAPTDGRELKTGSAKETSTSEEGWASAVTKNPDDPLIKPPTLTEDEDSIRLREFRRSTRSDDHNVNANRRGPHDRNLRSSSVEQPQEPRRPREYPHRNHDNELDARRSNSGSSRSSWVGPGYKSKEEQESSGRDPRDRGGRRWNDPRENEDRGAGRQGSYNYGRRDEYVRREDYPRNEYADARKREENKRRRTNY